MTDLFRKIFYGFKLNNISLMIWSCFYRQKAKSDIFDLIDLNTICPNGGHSCIHKNYIANDFLYDLTVIIPVYNAEKFIEDCVNSVLHQKTGFSYKIVIVNDGSTDGTIDKLSQYENISNIEIIYQVNKGHSGARNAGLQNICSKYVMFIDADDAIPENCIDVLLNKAIKGKFDIVQGDYETVSNGRVLGTFHNSTLCGYPWGKVYNSSLFKNVQFPEGVWFEDSLVEFILRDLSSSIGFVNDIVYLYSDNPNGITNNCIGKPKLLDSWYVTEQLFKDRIALSLKNTNTFLEVLLRQMIMNNWRIQSLKNNDLLKTVFVKECHLVKQICEDCVLNNYKYKLLLKIVNNVDYEAFSFFLRLY